MGGVSSTTKPEPEKPKTPQSKPKELDLNSKKFITPKQEVVNTTPKKDIFKEVKSEVASIQKSASQTSVNVQNKLEHSASKSRFLENVKQQKREAEMAAIVRAESQAKIEAAEKEKRSREASESRQRASESRRSSISSNASKKSNDDKPKKLDEVFGSIRETPMPPVKPVSPVPPIHASVWVDPDFDPGQKEISGISENVKLKKSARPKKPEEKKEKIKFELPAKKPKKAKPKEPSPPPLETVKTPTPPPPPPKSPTPPPAPSWPAMSPLSPVGGLPLTPAGDPEALPSPSSDGVPERLCV